MKNLLLGFSLAANVALGYMLLQDNDQMKDLKQKFDHFSDEAEGKAQQVKGAITGDAGDKIGGNVKEGEGKIKEFADSMGDNFD